MTLLAHKPPFTPAEETLTSSLQEEIADLKRELLDKDAEIERLTQELALADLTIERYDAGLM